MVINICRIVDPEVIIFGGGLAQAGDALLTAIRRYSPTHTIEGLAGEYLTV